MSPARSASREWPDSPFLQADIKMKFYGNGTDSGGTPAKHYVSIGDPVGPSGPVGRRGGGSLPSPDEFGKESLNLGDIPGSVEQSAGNFGDFLGGLGKLGIPGGPNLGGIAQVASTPVRFGAEVAGNALGAVGGIALPYLGNDPTKTNAHLGDVPGVVGGVLGAAGQFVETQAAKGRLTGDSGGTDLLAGAGRFLFGSKTDAFQAKYDDLVRQGKPIPADLSAALREVAAANAPGIPDEYQQRLDAGESVDKLAEEMAQKGVGYSNDPGANLLASVVLDPLNLLSFGAGKVGSVAKAADRALKAGEEIGVGSRFMATAYDAASRGLSRGGQALMDHTLGPATSGVFHALGTRPYQAIRSGLAQLAPQYADSFERAMAVGAGQLPPAIVAREIADDVSMAIRRKGQAALDGLGESIDASLRAKKTINPAELQRRAEELLLRVAPDFAGRDVAGIAGETIRKLALVADTSPEDAARVLGAAAGDLRTAQTVHLAAYGKAVDDFGQARAVAVRAKNIDVERLTLVAPDTLTTERAAEVLAGGPEALTNAVEHYPVLANRFSGTAFDHAEVKAFIGKLQKEGALVSAVRLPKSGRNALPQALGAWRAKYRDIGYDLGFAPEGGLKTIVDPDRGDVIYAEPFVQPTTEVDPLTMRNPLGRLMDGLFRGTTQTTIILDSRARFVRLTKDAGISPGEARGLHKLVLEESRRLGTTPRGLENYGELFSRYLGPERYAVLTAKHDPAFLVMSAFEGNLARVGLTQKATGAVKTATSERSNLAAAVAERIYPTIKFRLSPLFQLQELVESKVWNALRGIAPHPASPEIAKLYDELSQLPETRNFTEAGHYLHLWGSEAVERAMGHNTVLGRALQRVPNVADFKRRQQAMQIIAEHPQAFEEAVNAVNPRFWRAMTEAYGTTDARTVTERFMAERFDLQDPVKKLAAFDAAMPKTFASADEQTVWQAFRESLRSTSQQAFKTHFFDPRRGWLERSVNHPYLGLYPASYMWGKVLPEFARFLLLRPFGLKAPLLGARAYQRVQEAFVARLADDPEFKKSIDDNQDLAYAFSTLMPALPNDLPANAPAWARHLSQDLNGPKPIDPQTFVTREATDAATYAFGPTRTLSVGAGAVGDLGDLAGDLMGRLTKAAAQLDAQFGR
jgi:hypothetical protein